MQSAVAFSLLLVPSVAPCTHLVSAVVRHWPPLPHTTLPPPQPLQPAHQVGWATSENTESADASSCLSDFLVVLQCTRLGLGRPSAFPEGWVVPSPISPLSPSIQRLSAASCSKSPSRQQLRNNKTRMIQAPDSVPTCLSLHSVSSIHQSSVVVCSTAHHSMGQPVQASVPCAHDVAMTALPTARLLSLWLCCTES